MTLLTLYLLATTALIVSLAFIPLILVNAVPLKAVYHHSKIRKPVVLGILFCTLLWFAWTYYNTGGVPWTYWVPVGLMAFAVFIIYTLYPSIAFPAVETPKMSNDPLNLPIADKAQMAIIEYHGVTKAYPLDYVIHGHIVNDTFGDRLVALTYCALCRSIIPFDVTDIGPLYVGAMKNGNMVLADQRTKTFFQQGTFESVIGPLHPKTLEMIPFQFLTWKQVKNLDPLPQVCHVSANDFREFKLPIPGAWKKLTSGELTPGLSASRRDKTFPARTPIIGITDPSIKPQVAYLKSEVLSQGVVKNEVSNFFLIAQDETVNAFRASLNGQSLSLEIVADNCLKDTSSNTIWDVRGKHKDGPIQSDLEPVSISDEFWYAWKLFHPRSQVVRL